MRLRNGLDDGTFTWDAAPAHARTGSRRGEKGDLPPARARRRIIPSDVRPISDLRRFFARYVATWGRAGDPRIEEAFGITPREPFAGAGPWRINLPGLGYIETPDDDLAFIYQDTLVALNAARGINIGQPSAHARWLGALGLREGETVI